MKLIDVHRVLISQSFPQKTLSGGCFSRELKPTIPVDDKNAIFLAPGCNAGTSTIRLAPLAHGLRPRETNVLSEIEGQPALNVTA